MGEYFVSRRPLVPLPRISRKNACVEYELIRIVHILIGRVGRGIGVGVCNCIIDMTPDDLNGVSGGICLTEALVVLEPVRVGDHGVGIIDVGKQI